MSDSMPTVGAIIVLAFGLLARAGGQPEQERAALDNGFFRVRAVNGSATSLQVDPTGKGRYGPNWLLEMGFDGVNGTPGTRVVRRGNVVRFQHAAASVDERIEIKQGGVPDQLGLGHTLGQSFEVKRGYATRLAVCTPTWATPDSSAALSLRRDGLDGEVIAQRRLENVPDNSWQELTFEPVGAGRYYVELSDADGKIGWWSSRERKYGGGQAYADGKPVAGAERALRLYTRKPVGRAEVRFALDGPKLRVSARVTPLRGEQARSWPLIMKVRWDNEGYDVSSQSVPFFRFFTDNMRYMPTQQLKRWRERGGRYEVGFSGCKWIEADGTGDYDLRFHGRGLSLGWRLGGQETALRFGTTPVPEDGARANEVVLEALPRDDALPKSWPKFAFPERRTARQTNTFFYERAFTYPPVWGPAAWFEWNTLTRVWQGGAHIEALRQHLEDYPISDEGYVHTWGNGAGWPFPDTTKYDTRHFDTNARFILGCRRYAAWTGDGEFLQRQAERIRRAMNYQLNVLKGRDGLIVTASKDVTGRHRGIGDNYWDILPFGHLDAYANVVWYASLEAMAQIEEMLAKAEPATADPPPHSPTFYRRLAGKAREAYNETFWDEENGRYIGCVDVDGKKHDYGFTFVNLEAMAYGLADEEKVRRIYRWMEKEPTSTGEADTYSKWIFAPRATTLHNPRWNPQEGKLDDVPQEPWWHFGWHGTPFGDQCQDGGAILYTSFYDLMARCAYLGPDNAWRRWREILARWKMPDHLCGGAPLYRGEHPQQISPGAVGVDVPFPESGMAPCWLLYGVLGVRATAEGLEVAPRLPEAVPWIEVRNVAYRGLLLNIRGSADEVVISSDAPGRRFAWRRRLPPDGRVIFTEPPRSIGFPEKPVWQRGAAWRAQWIWLADSEAPRAFFRRTFELPAEPTDAWLSITADNSFVLYANGERVASGDNWTLLQRVDLAGHLRKGENVLAIAAQNTGGAGGLIAEGEVGLVNGKRVPLFTSRQWRVSQSAAPGWSSEDFDDTAWEAPAEYGSPPCSPWLDIGDPGEQD